MTSSISDQVFQKVKEFGVEAEFSVNDFVEITTAAKYNRIAVNKCLRELEAFGVLKSDGKIAGTHTTIYKVISLDREKESKAVESIMDLGIWTDMFMPPVMVAINAQTVRFSRPRKSHTK